MTEPAARAGNPARLPAGVRHWTIEDERIDHRSEAYAVGGVAIDPVPVADGAEGYATDAEPLAAILLTGAFHQRAAWSLRRATGAPVWVPAGAAGLDEPADREYRDGDALPGGLEARVVVGPRSPHGVFLLRERDGALSVFVGDLVLRGDDGPFRAVPPEHRTDGDGLARALQLVEALRPDRLYPAHGKPAIDRGHARMFEASCALAGERERTREGG